MTTIASRCYVTDLRGWKLPLRFRWSGVGLLVIESVEVQASRTKLIITNSIHTQNAKALSKADNDTHIIYDDNQGGGGQCATTISKQVERNIDVDDPGNKMVVSISSMTTLARVLKK